ncbi:MAG: hypothetical protein SX243_11590 [Acidobacteriota bacterium]|nr:hypothetical protein [Acidobacteriota bacterium]
MRHRFSHHFLLIVSLMLASFQSSAARAGDTVTRTGANDPSTDPATLQELLDNPDVSTLELRGTWRLDGDQAVTVTRSVEIVGAAGEEPATIRGSSDSFGAGIRIGPFDGTVRGVRVANLRFRYLHSPIEATPGWQADENCDFVTTDGLLVGLEVESCEFEDVPRGPEIYGDTRNLRIEDNVIGVGSDSPGKPVSVAIQGSSTRCTDTEGGSLLIPHGPVVGGTVRGNEMTGAAPFLVRARRLTFVDNSVRDVVVGQPAGLVVQDAEDVQVVGNRISGIRFPPPAVGIAVLGAVPGVQVVRNEIEDVDAGIGLLSATGAAVANNRFHVRSNEYFIGPFVGTNSRSGLPSCDNQIIAGGGEGTRVLDLNTVPCADIGAEPNRFLGGFQRLLEMPGGPINLNP